MVSTNHLTSPPNETMVVARPWELVVVASIAALGLGLFHIDQDPLWLDEAVTFYRARLPLADMAAASIRAGHTPFYFGLMHGWLAFGSSEFWMRLLSVIFFTLTIPVVYVIGRTISGPRAGVFASFILATAPYHIRYAQEARMYSMLTFFGAVAFMSLAFILARHGDDRPAWIGASLSQLRLRRQTPVLMAGVKDDMVWLTYILSVTAATFTHNTAVFLPVAMGLIFITAVWFAPQFRVRHVLNFAIANAIVVLLYAAYIPNLLQGAQRISKGFWVAEPTLGKVIAVFEQVYGNIHIRGHWHDIILLCLAAVALVGWLRTKRWHWAAWAIIGWLALPILELIASAILRPIFLHRTLIWSSIPFYLMLAVGAASLRPRIVQLVALTLLLASNLYGVSIYYDKGRIEREDWQRVAKAVADNFSGNDAVLFCAAYVYRPFNYYWRAYRRDVAQFGVRPGTGPNMVKRMRSLDADPAAAKQKWSPPQPIDSLLGDYDRVWLVFSHSHRCNNKKIRDNLAENGRLIDGKRFRGIDVFVYDRAE